jgi:uncharacterized protein (DUF2235 family)
MGKNIVICCDGTKNDVTTDSTNVLRFFRSLVRKDEQIAYYDCGVGTISDPTKLTRIGRYLNSGIDMAIGHSVRDNVCRAYRFLCQCYSPGDKIYLIGFSRGAYTVRALAGMIHMLGILRRELQELDRLAWSVYSDDRGILSTSARFGSANRFKNSFSIGEDSRIEFVGVWDTVNACGWIWDPFMVPYTSNNSSINHIRHALSIDERRALFQPNLFRPKNEDQHKSFKQIWFAGSHGDVGGGYPERESGLAKVSLEWMYNEANACGCLLDRNQTAHFLGQVKAGENAKPDILDKSHESTKGLLYNLLEFVPRKHWNSGTQKLGWHIPNFYRRRAIQEQSQFHLSVKDKLEKDSDYKPTNLPREINYCT